MAAQRTLGNLFAGVQLAITQPVCVGDAVLFEGEWGWIEEIAMTYVVIRTWDLRRLVVPTSHLIDNLLQNWTLNGENMMKPVYLFADYRIPVDEVREELGRILEGMEDWDHEVPPILDVTGCTAETVELRALCSARNPSSAWKLHCEVREKLLAFVRDVEEGEYLPRHRLVLAGGSGRAWEWGDGRREAGSHPTEREDGRSKGGARRRERERDGSSGRGRGSSSVD